MSQNPSDDRFARTVRGEEPTFLVRMKTGVAVIGDTQFLPGYCLLLSYPKAPSLNDLPVEKRLDFLKDMSLLGDAITMVCKPLRLNYEILGNTDPFLHAHIFPRYSWEEEVRRKSPVWQYPGDRWTASEYQYDEVKHADLKNRIAAELKKILEDVYGHGD